MIHHIRISTLCFVEFQAVQMLYCECVRVYWKEQLLLFLLQFLRYRVQKVLIYQYHFAEIAEYECKYIIKSQLEDGSWGIPWGWSDHPEEWTIAKKWWKVTAQF